VADAIREAKAHGDLKENAAYHEAKLNQTRLESRIAEMEKMFQMARIVDASEGLSGAQLGSQVKLHDLEYDEELDIHLVSSFEADPMTDRISISSPMGEALLGRQAGDEVEVTAPGGATRYRILS